MFEGFDLELISLRDATLCVRHGGTGPPLLLLHGHPRTHTTWHSLSLWFVLICAVLVNPRNLWTHSITPGPPSEQRPKIALN